MLFLAGVINMLVQPSIFNGLDNLATSAPAIVRANLLYFSSASIGSEVNQTDYFSQVSTPSFFSGCYAVCSRPTVLACFSISRCQQWRPSLNTPLALAILKVCGGRRPFQLIAPAGVALLSQLLAYLSGIAAAARLCLIATEKANFSLAVL